MATVNNRDTLYNFIYDWCDRILNTELALTIPIIASNDNAPAPTGSYICVDVQPTSNKIGQYSAGDPANGTTRNLVNDNEFLLELREVRGVGDKLQLLIQSIDRQDIQDLFYANGVSYMGEGQIQGIPSLKNKLWKAEAVCELRLNVATTTVEATTYISEVEFINNI